jgi:hypothetical protein
MWNKKINVNEAVREINCKFNYKKREIGVKKKKKKKLIFQMATTIMWTLDKKVNPRSINYIAKYWNAIEFL